MRMNKIAVSALCAALVAGTAAPLSSLAYDRSGWSVSATHTKDGNADNVRDHDYNTRWSTDQSNKEFIVDFGAKKTFDTIEEYNGKSQDIAQGGHKVYISDNGTDYTEVSSTEATVNNGTNIEGNVNNRRYVTTIKLETSVSARYLKLVGTGTGSAYWSINELGVYKATVLDKAGQSSVFSDCLYAEKGSITTQNDSDREFEINILSDSGSYLGGKTNDGLTNVAFANDVDSGLKAEFGSTGSESDTLIADVYTSRKIDYIGNGNNHVKLSNLNLKKGTYKLYVLGYNNSIGTVTCGSNTVTGGNKTDIANNVQLYTYEIKLDSDYSGDIVMSNSSGWLPDIYSAKLKCISAAKDSTVSAVTALNDGAAFNVEGATDASAMAYVFTVNPNGYTVSKVTVTVTSGENSKSLTKAVSLSGDAEFGIIVKGAVDTPVITVDID